MFEVKYSNQALKFLKKNDEKIVSRIFMKIALLKKEPFPQGVRRIESQGLFRIRIGNIRILYEVDYKNNLIGIAKIDKRSKVYD